MWGVFLFISLAFTGFAQAEEPEYFSVPKPPQSELMDTHQMRMGGADVNSFLYSSPASQDQIMRYYEDYFRQKEFETIFNNTYNKKRVLRVKKEDRIVNVAAMPKDGNEEVVIAHYLLPKGASPFEELKSSWEESISYLPKEDKPGEDLSFIPRPPESIRVGRIDHENRTYITYISTEPVGELKEFYKNNMAIHGWAMAKELDIQEAVNKYRGMVGSKKAFKPDLPSGISMDELIAGGSILNFQGQLGKAQINVVNLSGKNQGSFVQVEYAQE